MVRFLKSQAASQNDVFEQVERAIDQTFGRRSTKGLKALVSDLSEWCDGLSNSARAELNQMLAASQMATLESDIRDCRHEAHALIRRGKILTGDEYRLLMRYRELVHPSEASLAELEKLDKMLRDANTGGHLPD